ncbi:MAG: hypothetical protein ABSA45_06525 [Verrucomicrobiota bacterium]
MGELPGGHLRMFGPAEILGHGAVPLRVGGGEPAADFCVAEQPVQGKEVARVAAALVADLQQLSGLPHRLHHRTGAFDGVAHHLFAIDMESRLEAGVGNGCVPEIRRGHDNGLQILFPRQQVLIIFVGPHLHTERIQVTLAVSARVWPDVHDGDEPDAVDFQKRFQQHAALRAEADERDVDFVVRGFGLAKGICAGNQHQAGAGGGRRADEFPAGNGLVYHFLRSANLLCLASISAKATSAT